MMNQYLIDHYISKKIDYLRIISNLKIMDIHIHVGEGEYGQILYPKVDENMLTDILRNNAITSALIFSNYHESYKKSNKEIATICKKNNMFIGLGRINTGNYIYPKILERILYPRSTIKDIIKKRNMSKKNQIEALEEIEKCIKDYRLKGIKLAPMQDGLLTDEQLELISQLGCVLLIHDTPYRIERQILKKTDIPILIPHLGGYPNITKNYEYSIELARKYPNVFLDISNVLYHFFIYKAVEKCQDKILFGSDFPAVHPGVGIMMLLSLDIKITVLEKIFYFNAQNLLK